MHDVAIHGYRSSFLLRLISPTRLSFAAEVKKQYGSRHRTCYLLYMFGMHASIPRFSLGFPLACNLCGAVYRHIHEMSGYMPIAWLALGFRHINRATSSPRWLLHIVQIVLRHYRLHPQGPIHPLNPSRSSAKMSSKIYWYSS